jgi:catechol 2,3-dioxygenase-like lactoylglutathione lyase family enzyme
LMTWLRSLGFLGITLLGSFGWFLGRRLGLTSVGGGWSGPRIFLRTPISPLLKSVWLLGFPVLGRSRGGFGSWLGVHQPSFGLSARRLLFLGALLWPGLGLGQQSRTSVRRVLTVSLASMIQKMSHTSVYVLDQDSAKEFYTTVLGFELQNDLVMGDGFEGGGKGFRWLTVSPPGQPDVQFILADPRMGHAPEHAEVLRELVAKGALGNGVLATDDCRATFEELSARGVVFLQEPAERPYGIEATFRDDSGNVYSLTQAYWAGKSGPTPLT